MRIATTILPDQLVCLSLEGVEFHGDIHDRLLVQAGGAPDDPADPVAWRRLADADDRAFAKVNTNADPDLWRQLRDSSASRRRAADAIEGFGREMLRRAGRYRRDAAAYAADPRPALAEGCVWWWQGAVDAAELERRGAAWQVAIESVEEASAGRAVADALRLATVRALGDDAGALPPREGT